MLDLAAGNGRLLRNEGEVNMTDAWKRLEDEAARLRGATLRTLWEGDPGRFGAFSWRMDDLLLDCSKERIDAGALEALVALARDAGVEGAREALFSGAAWNLTEGRAVLHMALRRGADAPDGDDVAGVLGRMLAFAEDVRAGRYRAEAGAFTDIINIGIGGSDLGPAMVARALEPDRDGPRLHFVSNVDGAHLADVVRGLDPARTLVIVASKTFTTQETMTNARSARAWLEGAVGDRAGAHMAAVSTNIDGAGAFGIDADRVFGFWDWVGGRYSVWSAIGLPVAIGIGAADFRRFLDGAAAMDRHFRTAPLGENLPVLLALIGIWRRNAMGWPSVALIPYDQRLERFAAYVQQLDMESNGKRTTRAGGAVARASGPVIWGEPGTNAQHSFFQLLHQGTDIVPVDFIVAANPREGGAAAEGKPHHAALLANCLAQSEALAFGRSEAEVRAAMAGAAPEEIERLAAHRTFPGNRPSTTILHGRLDPYSLGRLIALFEHKVFVQGVIWDVNSFDQWGVELGKELAAGLLPVIGGEAEAGHPSTAGLVGVLRGLKNEHKPSPRLRGEGWEGGISAGSGGLGRKTPLPSPPPAVAGRGSNPDIGPRTPPASAALSRYTVLDLTRVRSGPTCVRQLADWGADVIRIETPEDTAEMGGPRAGADFQNIHRNKRSLTLNLKSPEGMAVFRRLADRADVVVENFRPDVKTRLGIDYETLSATNPGLVYASISGFGQDGPLAGRPGFDQIAQGMGGLMSITGEPGAGPMRVGIPIADLCSGIFAAQGVLVALLEREASGRGQWVQTSLLQAQVFMLDFQGARFLMDGEVAGQAGNNHPTMIPTGVFATSDGHMNIAVAGEAIWQRLARTMGREDWIEDARYRDAEGRSTNRDALNAEIGAITAGATTAHWVATLTEAGVPAGEIEDIGGVFRNPQVEHLGMAAPMTSTERGETAVIAQPMTLSRTPSTIAAPPPTAGEHTDAILTALGYGAEDIARMRGDGVV